MNNKRTNILEWVDEEDLEILSTMTAKDWINAEKLFLDEWDLYRKNIEYVYPDDKNYNNNYIMKTSDGQWKVKIITGEEGVIHDEIYFHKSWFHIFYNVFGWDVHQQQLFFTYAVRDLLDTNCIVPYLFVTDKNKPSRMRSEVEK